MLESRPLPAIARTAHRYACADFQRTIEELGRQAVAALGLTEADDCIVDFEKGLVHREVPDPAPVDLPVLDDSEEAEA
jgi:hypothetical protein